MSVKTHTSAEMALWLKGKLPNATIGPSAVLETDDVPGKVVTK